MGGSRLQLQCERMVFSVPTNIPARDSNGVATPAGRRSVLKLAHRAPDDVEPVPRHRRLTRPGVEQAGVESRRPRGVEVEDRWRPWRAAGPDRLRRDVGVAAGEPGGPLRLPQ
ncbi:unnamed protein product [Urochloa humidicola]